MWKATGVAICLSLMMTGVAEAHTETEMDEWNESWLERADDALSRGLLAEFESMQERHPWYWSSPDMGYVPVPPPMLPRGRGMGSDVEQWRDLVRKWFPASAVETMLCLMQHESGGNPDAYNSSGASGLFQVMPRWFEIYGGDPFDPENNAKVAARVYEQQGFSAWNPYKRGECR